MKNKILYILFLFLFLFPVFNTVSAQSQIFLKAGFGSGTLIDYKGIRHWGLKNSSVPVRFTPDFEIEYRTLNKKNDVTILFELGLTRQVFHFSAHNGGLGQGFYFDGNFQVIHGFATVGMLFKCNRFFNLRLATGAMKQLHGTTDAIAHHYGPSIINPDSTLRVEDCFRSLFPIGEIGLELPFRRIALEIMLRHGIFTRYAIYATRTNRNFQPQLALWRVAVLYPIWHHRAKDQKS